MRALLFSTLVVLPLGCSCEGELDLFRKQEGESGVFGKPVNVPILEPFQGKWVFEYVFTRPPGST